MFPSMTRNLAASRAGDSDNIEKIVMMNEFASIRTRGSSDPGRAGTGNRPGALQVLIVSLLVLLVALVAAGCSGGEGSSEDTNAGGESLGKDANVVVMFPQHGAPLGTDNGDVITLGVWS